MTLAERIRPCTRCFNLTEHELCDICRDPRRDVGLLCAVEEASDIGAIERTGEFRGLYHVLGGRLSPLDGVGPEDLTIPQLLHRVEGGGMVTVEADGKGQVRKVKIDPAVVSASDVEMLEDLVLVAVSEAQKKAAALAQEQMGKLTGGLDLPFKMPF